MHSTEPFNKTFKRLLEDRDLALRALARRCQQRDGWGSAPTFTWLIRGDALPTRHAMESIAGALAISPDTFAEYRLMIAREQLDPDVVGLKAALGRLDEITGVESDENADKPAGRTDPRAAARAAEEALRGSRLPKRQRRAES